MNYLYKVLGVKRLNFTNDQGTIVDGVQLWLCAPTSNISWLGGMEVFKVWIDVDSPLFDTACSLRHGDEITGDCDRRGKPISIQKA